MPSAEDARTPAASLSRWRPSPRRLAQLLPGLWLFGSGEALLVNSGLGNSPWTVLAQGAARRGSVTVGTATIVISALILAAWIPLRQRPGLGTVLNAVLIGVAIDVTLSWLPHREPFGAGLAEVAGGILLVGVGSGLYLTTALGPGPRDGLMTGLHERLGRSQRSVRFALECTALTAGFALGGTVGLGTVLFAVGIGPTVQFMVETFARGRSS